jgi:hypothetical protein
MTWAAQRLGRGAVGRVLSAGVVLCGVALAGISPAVAASSWTIQPTPNVAGAKFNNLEGVSCAGRSLCMAVGYSSVESGSPSAALGTEPINSALAEEWNGKKWAIVPSAAPPGLTSNAFSAVACPAADSCFATVNGHHGQQNRPPVIEHWNGSGWQVQDLTLPVGTTLAELASVSCGSPTQCWAAGDLYAEGGSERAFVEEWNGSAWSLGPPFPAADYDYVQPTGISAQPGGTYMMVGQLDTTSGAADVFAARWDGTHWKVHGFQGPPGYEALLWSVSCPSASMCEAVGTSNANALAYDWNGSAWTAETLPTVDGQQPDPISVSCFSAKRCIVAGVADGTWVAERVGSTWVTQPTLDRAGGANALDAVACTAAGDCEAVGTSWPTSQMDLTLAEHN